MPVALVTGSASGIGAAARVHLERAGWRVIGVNRRGDDVAADLAQPAGRAKAIEALTGLLDGRLDAVIAGAGVNGPTEAIVQCNYFGTVAVLEGVRPLLSAAPSPAAIVVGSVAAVHDTDRHLVDVCLDGDEERAVGLATTQTVPSVYAATRRALVRWMRRTALAPDWVGSGIRLNMVAFGLVDTPMIHDALLDEQRRSALQSMSPMPLCGPASADEAGSLLALMLHPALRSVTGQVLFADGGAEAVLRGELPWA